MLYVLVTLAMFVARFFKFDDLFDENLRETAEGPDGLT